MTLHFIFDLLAYALSISLSVFIFKAPVSLVKDETEQYIYYTYLIIGFVVGSILFGSINDIYSLKTPLLGKSVLGAIFGGTIMVEIFKKIYKIQGSTGAYFVPSLSIGIVIGRIGCFYAGLEDYTYGIATDGPFAYDFGDGIPRHPVQLYESFSMALFFIFSVLLFKYRNNFFKHYMFYLFILYYSTQRLFLEFLKPYETMFIGLNFFQLICLVLILYALIQIRSTYRRLYPTI